MNGENTNPAAKPKRRTFTAEYKLRIVAEHDACTSGTARTALETPEFPLVHRRPLGQMGPQGYRIGGRRPLGQADRAEGLWGERPGPARAALHAGRTIKIDVGPRVQGPPETQTRFHSPQPLVSKAMSEPLMVTI